VSTTSPSNQRPLLIRNRNFALVWLGQVLSQSGSKAYLINLLWWIIQSAKSEGEAAMLSGALLVLTALPGIVFVKPIGHLLSRYPSKKLLVVGESLAAMLVALIFGLLFFDNLTMPVLFVLSFAIATCQAVVDPTLTNAVPQLVPQADIEGAVGLEATTQSLAYFVGTGVGATLTGLLGLHAALFLNIVSYVISAIASGMAHFVTAADAAPTAAEPAAAESAEPSAEPSSSFQAMGLTALMVSFATANFFIAPVFLVLPIFIKQVIQGSITQLGMLEACFWLGLIFGAMISTRLFTTWAVQKITGFLLGIFGVMMVVVWLFPNLYWAGVVLFVGGSAVGVVNVKMITYFQRVVPDSEKGHFFARLQAFATSSQPLGYFAFSLFLANLSSPLAFALQGLGLCCVAVFCLRLKLKVAV
jgi:MFS family permease